MTDRLDFEARLEERLRARAALASRPFDAATIARQVVAVGGRRRRIGRLEWPSTNPAIGWLVVALLLAIAVLGAVAVAGAIQRERQPERPLAVSNGWIAASANPNDVGSGEAGDIYLVGEGAPARRIIGSDGDGVAQACPRFSPDGRRLAYGEGRPSFQLGDDPLRGRASVADRAVVVVGIDDHGAAIAPIVRVAPPPSGPGQIACPEWSSDSERVAFRIGNELWVADATSGETTAFPVVVAPRGQEGFEWSRDGSLIAVSEPGQIRVIRLDGGAPTVIPVEAGTPGSLGWTAGDARIVYLSTDAPGDGQGVHVVGADGTNETQLTPEGGDVQLTFEDVIVSPNGARLAYLQRTYRCTSDSCTQDPERLLTMDLDGSHVIELAIPPDLGVSGLQWSPDGERLLIGSIAGVVSVAVMPGSPAIVHSSRELNMEWSGEEVTWQPVLR
jgi:dipeptidyl aminopeptidase/acylaminoacyl peptidase